MGRHVMDGSGRTTGTGRRVRAAGSGGDAGGSGTDGDVPTLSNAYRPFHVVRWVSRCGARRRCHLPGVGSSPSRPGWPQAPRLSLQSKARARRRRMRLQLDQRSLQRRRRGRSCRCCARPATLALSTSLASSPRWPCIWIRLRRPATSKIPVHDVPKTAFNALIIDLAHERREAGSGSTRSSRAVSGPT